MTSKHHFALGKIGGRKTNAKSFDDLPLTLEEAARYLSLPISLLRDGCIGKPIHGVEPPRPWQKVGRAYYFIVPELDAFNERRGIRKPE